jgi:hypothetical protein
MTDRINNTDDKERIERAKAAGWTGIIVRDDNGKIMGKPPLGREGEGWYDVKEIPQ